LVVGGLAAAAGESPVHVELVQAQRGAVDAPAQWAERLNRLPLASLRVRSARPGDRPRVERRGTADRPVFHVTGLLGPRNELQLPGATFRLGQDARLGEWFDGLRVDGASPAKSASRFGLDDAALAKLKQDLSSAWPHSTAGAALRSIVAQIQQQVPLSLVIDPTARTAFSRPAMIIEDYQGLATGTALSAALHTAGLGWVPEKNERGSITLRVVVAGAVDEVWPVGWPTQRRTQDAVPKLMERLPVEIVDTPLSETLAAIGPRVGVPLLVDRPALALQKIELSEVRVNHPAGRTYYKRLLDRVLFQGRLEMVIREDDAGRAFLWIAPIRQPSRPDR
jgi:hypothetical protein